MKNLSLLNQCFLFHMTFFQFNSGFHVHLFFLLIKVRKSCFPDVKRTLDCQISDMDIRPLLWFACLNILLWKEIHNECKLPLKLRSTFLKIKVSK